MKPPVNLLVTLCAIVCTFISSCGNKPAQKEAEAVENLYADSISTSYTIAMPDTKGEGIRMTYTFFNMKERDTGNFKMTHVYMRHTGEEDTTIVNGTWALLSTDSGGVFIRTYSGRMTRDFDYIGGGIQLLTLNTDSLIADTGMLHFRRKVDNNMRNSTVMLIGTVVSTKEKPDLQFVDIAGDTIPIMKISAYPDLLALSDSIDISKWENVVDLIGTIQIRMSMDGRKTQKSLIVEEVVGLHKQ